MSDSYGDGWNGNVLAIIQNGATVGTFGSNFISGFSSGPIYIAIQSNLLAVVAVSTLGSYTNEIGFIIKSSNQTTIYQWATGYTFTSTTVFTSFCLAGGCAVPANLTLNITMTDSFGDGWNGNILAVKQNGATVGTFGNGFSSGSTFGPTYITVQGNQQAQIVVSTLGSYTS